MAKTLLSITQEILTDISGDDVSSIFDTEEAEAVARHVVATYDNLVSTENWPWMRRAVQFVPSTDTNFPTYMTLPSNVKELISLYYDIRKNGETRKKYTEMRWKSPDDFLRHCNARVNTNSNVQTISDPSGVEIFVRNDLAPTYFTSFDDTTLIFDSFDSEVDSILQESKTQGFAYVLLTLPLADDSVPDLPLDVERLLIEKATIRVQWKEKELQDVVAADNASKQERNMSRNAWRTNKPTRYPNYGRKSRHYRDPTFGRNR